MKTVSNDRPAYGRKLFEASLGKLIGALKKYKHIYGVKTLIKQLDRLNKSRIMLVHYLYKETTKDRQFLSYESLMPKANRESDLCLKIINRFQKLRSRIENANVRYVSGNLDGSTRKYNGKLKQLLW